MRTIPWLVLLLLGCFVLLLAVEKPASAAIRFDGDAARRQFAAYVAFLERDPARYRSELATVRQLEQSDVEYRVRIGGDFKRGVDGNLTTDGLCVFVGVSDGTGANGKGAATCTRFSERACLAHELEHARQFDSGEFAFGRDTNTGRWGPDPLSFDIGDEVSAWMSQLNVATNEDFWRRVEGSARPEPSLLAKFAAATTVDGRARVLIDNGYGRLNRTVGKSAALPAGEYQQGELIRPAAVPNMFCRVSATTAASTAR